MKRYNQLLAELVSALGHDAVRSGDAIAERYLSDWSGAAPVLPIALVCPIDTAGVAQALSICHTHRVAVVPQGGLTGLAGGAVPVADGIALSLERMQTIEHIDSASATVTVQAGASLQTVQEAALALGLELGVDFGARGSAQIGGLLATNAGGNGVVQHGMAREQVLGLEVVLADGTVLPMLRPMCKNNTGYDLKHWFIGSEGTLGVITRALLSLSPAPQARATAMVALPHFSSAIALLRRLQADFPGTLAAYELMWSDFFQTALGWYAMSSPFPESHPFYALIDVTGAKAETLADLLQDSLAQAIEAGDVLDAVVAQSLAQAQTLWRIREATAEFPTKMNPLNFDVSLPLDQMDAYATECALELFQRWPGQRSLRFGHLGDGNLHLTTDLSSLGTVKPMAQAEREVEELVFGLLAKRAGSVSAEHGIGQHKKSYLKLSRSPAELGAMRAIKLALDPLCILNPGKIFDL